ncbi:SphA family protein [Caballeronia sordidicola]|uniref:Protein involved in meta-pathway of phenol degradation n=1 Tax=Caballeronia sordidicola TaxID=196367 RepID=A0A226WLH4_CABSO|nr:transporter [Caballeronia sordidicola]OXC72032.1 Protein involved in meta-pathway of phenol degradation [Caballeronia sordidicola]
MKRKPTHRRRFTLGTIVAMCSASCFTTPSMATEGGGSIYPAGAENYGCCALPPPGLYGQFYAEQYNATSLRDNDGNRSPVNGFQVKASAIVPRLIWVTNAQILGGSLAFHTIAPLITLGVQASGESQRKTGVGDVDVGAAVGWHFSPQLHALIAVDGFAPTGGYDKNDLANIGRNYWAIQPIVGISRIDPEGLNGDAKVMYTINSINKATDYHSGQELIVDYSLGYGLFKHWVVGVGGYWYVQTTDDRQYGATIANNRGRSFSIGPSIKYDSGKGWFASLKYETETMVRNRADGGAFWLKATFPIH